ASVPLSGPLSAHAIIPDEDLVRQSDNKIQHSDKSNQIACIAFDPIVSEGIVRFEGEFEKHWKYDNTFGIADASAVFAPDKWPGGSGNKKKTVRYECDGRLQQLGEKIRGNSKFLDPLAMEVNMSATPRTLRFFMDNEEQPISVINIPSSIRFYIFFREEGSSFTVTKFEYLQSPTAKGEIEEARVLEWGKNWKQNEDEEDEAEDESKDEIPSQVQIHYTPKLPNPDCVKVKGHRFTAIEENASTILFDPVIKKGITRFEVLNVSYLLSAGIADESLSFVGDVYPSKLDVSKIVDYSYYEGNLQHIGDWIKGNEGLEEGDRIAMELNMESSPRTLTFFVNDKEQPNYVSNVPDAVRFFAYIAVEDSLFKILKFEEIPEPTAKHESESRSLEYGTEWKNEQKEDCTIQ
ncbi:MAG: hypothetical protein EZS28_021566, partial [Streblomastix strix]